MFDTSAQCTVAEIRILLEGRKRRRGRLELSTARTAAGAEMRHGMHGIQKRLRVCSGKIEIAIEQQISAECMPG